MKYLSYTLNYPWKQWRSEYLTELRKSHRHLLKKSDGKPWVSEGDVVANCPQGESSPRSYWKLGHVLIVRKDGKIRGATVGIASKNRHFTSLNHPLHNYCTPIGNQPFPWTHRHSTINSRIWEQSNSRVRETRQVWRPTHSSATSSTCCCNKGQKKQRQWTRELQHWEFWLWIEYCNIVIIELLYWTLHHRLLNLYLVLIVPQLTTSGQQVEDVVNSFSLLLHHALIMCRGCVGWEWMKIRWTLMSKWIAHQSIIV